MLSGFFKTDYRWNGGPAHFYNIFFQKDETFLMGHPYIEYQGILPETRGLS
ncbi:hypothetical protein B0G93_104155 [Bacillus sp. V-88]|jgi:hypothetical protein|nr:hypothetical protein B0G93_104155 [Bacillus sp. V-88]SLK18884.1 hypothetical protein SAMN06295884_104155 [Bacillus sp. V-88]